MARPVGRLSTIPILLTGVLTLGGAGAHAQDFRGTIEGRVVDASGGALPGVAVSAMHGGTGVGAIAVTNDQGMYQIPLLPPGVYRIICELQGFRRVERPRIELRVEDRVVVNVTMEIGEMKEVVTVTAETPVLEEASGSAGQIIDGKRIELMPLSDGNPFTLAALPRKHHSTRSHQPNRA